MSPRHAVVLAGLWLLLGPALAAHAGDQRRQAEACAARGDQAGACRYYRQTAQHYRNTGDEQAALTFDSLADQWEPVLRGFRDRQAPTRELQRFYTGQKAEPIYGCLIGVNCFTDPNVEGFDGFCDLTGKRHAMYYDYAYHGHLDSAAASLARPEGPWFQAACELRGSLSDVQPGEELEAWAKQLAQTPGTVFLRWCHEMNGDWTSWHGDPDLYIQKFRLVHDVMARLAPNVAMVWCPNATPAPQIDCYYPGDDYVDWVGVNSYVVTIHDNDSADDASHENPADLFREVYRRYSARKPIMICETGVTHYALASARDESAFAAARIGQLYGCLPRLFPRIKGICYYDVDNIRSATNGRVYNNYLLSDRPQVLDAYRRAIRPDYFLSGPQSPEGPLPAYVEPLADGQTLSGKTHLTAWAKSHDLTPTVSYKLDGKSIDVSRVAGTYDCTVDCSTLSPGPHTLCIAMQAQSGKVLKQVGYRIRTEQ